MKTCKQFVLVFVVVFLSSLVSRYLFAVTNTIADSFAADQENRLSFTPIKAKFVLVELERRPGDLAPAIDELEIFGPEVPGKNLANAVDGAKAIASDCIVGYAIHRTEHINDGYYGNDHSWVATETDHKPFIRIELAEPAKIDTVIFSRDRYANYQDRLPATVSISVSEDGKKFTGVEKIAFEKKPSKVVPIRMSSTWANVPLPPNVPQPQEEVTGSSNDAMPIRLPKNWPVDDLGFENLALAKGAIARASSCIAGHAIHRVEHLNDGLFGNDHSWVAERNPCWAEIDLGDVYTVYNVAFGSDSSGKFQDRGTSLYSILVATEYDADSHAACWTKVAPGKTVPNIQYRTEFKFPPRPARYVRIVIDQTSYNAAARIDELEVFGRKGEITAEEIALFDETTIIGDKNDTKSIPVDLERMNAEWKTTLVDEEYAWLKAFGRADIDPGLVYTPYPIQRHPIRVPSDVTTLVRVSEVPILDGRLDESVWHRVSDAAVRVAKPGTFNEGAAVDYTVRAFLSDDRLYVAVSTNRLLSAHLAIFQTAKGGGVVAVTRDKLVWRNYVGNDNGIANDVPLEGAVMLESSGTRCSYEFAIPLDQLPEHEKGVTIRAGIGGRYTPVAGHPIRFYPADVAIVSQGYRSDAKGHFALKLVNHSQETRTVSNLHKTPIVLQAQTTVEISLPVKHGEIGPERNLDFNIVEQGIRGALHLFRYDPVGRTLDLLEKMIGRMCDKITPEYAKRIADAEKTLNELREKTKNLIPGSPEERMLFLAARMVKRELFFADPNMSEIETILFEKRFPLLPSHNYSDYYDSTWREGGGIYTLHIPREGERFVPEHAVLTELFKTTGMSRHPVADFDANKIYFTNRTAVSEYWHIMEMNPDGSGLRQVTDGPFHDLWPCPLPDDGLAFISTRCRQKFLCWEPQASVLYRMNKDGGEIKRLSFANLTEFAPSVSRDGRILWTRSEYLDKGADYGHTLWYIRPDGAIPELTFGNTIVLPQGYANGREIPGTNQVSCVMISHFGDLNGPVAILDIDKGRLNPHAIESITPEVPWPGFWARNETFREPFPIATDLFLVAHSPRDRFGLFIIDRFGNRELLYMDETLGAMCPTPLKTRPMPYVLSSGVDPTLAEEQLGVFTVEDVYRGIEHAVPHDAAKYIRVSQEMPHFLEKYADGTYRASHQPYMEFYASPVDLVAGPYGWTSYVAKGDLGTAEVEEDGSASFLAPSGKVLFFQLLDENYNEIQRMRSVVQLQPGESRSCIGCHEDRAMVPTRHRTIASQSRPKPLTPSPWGAGAFDYQKAVQPVFDRNCVSCHNADDPKKVDLTGTLDADNIPSSFKTIIRGGYVHHFNWGYQAGVPTKAEPYTFGTAKSVLWSILGDENHINVKLTSEEERAIKCWVDLSCPLWPDYKQRRLRGDANAHDGTIQTP